MKLLTDSRFVFLSTVFFSLEFKWDDTIPTACVNGLTMKVNPSFFMDLNQSVQLFVLLHETWHVALKHIIRAKQIPEENFLLFNYAADYVINDSLHLDGVQLWESCLHDDKYRGWSTEQVYKDLLADPPEEPDPSYLDIEVTDSSSTGKEEETVNTAVQDKLDRILMKAATQAELSKSQGHMPGEVKRYIDDLKEPKLDWSIILHRYLNEFIKTDYSWSRPNRRYMPEHYLPTLHNPGMENLAVAWDLSASVTEEEISIMMTEVEEARRKLQPVTTTVVTFDSKVQAEQHIQLHTPITDVGLVGGGGTWFDPVIEHFQKNPPNLLIIFSDMCAQPITKIPDFPVIWVGINAPENVPKQPVGEVIHYTHKE